MLGSARTRRFRALYLRELGLVWTVLRRLGVDEGQVEDAAHDVFVVVHRQLDEFEGRSSERTWLYAITRRIAWRYRRAQHRRDRRRAALAREAEPLVAPPQDEALRRREAERLLQRFLDGLDRSKREAFVLGEIERLPRDSLGQALGVSPGTAYSRLRAARADFAATFGTEGRAVRGLRRAAGSTESPPRAVQQRLWLALPGGFWGAVGGAKLVVGGALAGAVLVAGAWPLLRAEAPAVPSRGEVEPAPSVAASSDREHAAPRSKPRDSEAPRPVPTTAEPRVEPSPSIAELAAPPTPPRSSPAHDDPGAEAAPADALAAEAELMIRARAAMRAEDWPEAWEQLSLHEARFARGTLVRERALSMVRVACALGRPDDALPRARALLGREDTPARAREALRSSCVGERLLPDTSVINTHAAGDQEG